MTIKSLTVKCRALFINVRKMITFSVENAQNASDKIVIYLFVIIL